MNEPNETIAEDRRVVAKQAYEAPSLVRYGTLAELTKGNGGGGGDFNSEVS